MKQQSKNKKPPQYYNQQQLPKFQKKISNQLGKQAIKPAVIISPHQISKYSNPKIQMPISSKKISQNQRSRQKYKQKQKVHQSNQQLLKELQNLRKNNQIKKDTLFGIHKNVRIQLVRNQKLKSQLSQLQTHMDQYKRIQIKKMKQEYENHKQSPLFYNQNGLSPFELILLAQTRITSIQGNICMVCFMDFQQNQKALVLPCGHFLHKQCGVQHLLYSKLCPACNQFVIIGE